MSESNALDLLYQSANRLSDAHVKFMEGNELIFKEFTKDFQAMLELSKVGPKWAALPDTNGN